jgi:hypothetical protein
LRSRFLTAWRAFFFALEILANGQLRSSNF